MTVVSERRLERYRMVFAAAHDTCTSHDAMALL